MPQIEMKIGISRCRLKLFIIYTIRNIKIFIYHNYEITVVCRFGMNNIADKGRHKTTITF